MSDTCPCTPETGIDLPSPPVFPAFSAPIGTTPALQGGTSTSGVCPDTPAIALVSESFVTPAIDSAGQLVSKCAYKWALPGLDLMIPPFGRVTITGVAGDNITFTNKTIQANRTINSGSALFMVGGWDVGAASNNPVDYLVGYVNGRPQLLSGAEGTSLKRVKGADDVIRWQTYDPVSGGLFFFPMTPTVVFSSTAKDISGTTINLPGFPETEGAKIPVLSVNWVLATSENTSLFRDVMINGYSIAKIGGFMPNAAPYVDKRMGALCGPGFISANPVNVSVITTNTNPVVNFTVTAFEIIIHGWLTTPTP